MVASIFLYGCSARIPSRSFLIQLQCLSKSYAIQFYLVELFHLMLQSYYTCCLVLRGIYLILLYTAKQRDE